MREPGIHITRQTFAEVYSEVMGKPLAKRDINEFFRKAKGFSIDNRMVIAKNAKSRKAVASLSNAPLIAQADMLANIIYSVRIKMKHVGVVKIKQSDPQWTKVKELTGVINSFCDKYGLDTREGYIKYVEIGLKLLSNSKRANFSYCASWMAQRSDWIISVYEADKAIKEDPDPKATLQVHDYYVNRVLEMTGLNNNYCQDTPQYRKFIEVKDLAKSLGISYEDFIDAQFEALAFCNGIPKLEDLYSNKAKDRLANYISKYGIRIRKKKISETLWDSFKK